MQIFKILFLLTFLSLFTLGFRVIPGGNNWKLSPSEPVLWIQFCEKPEIEDNDLPSSAPYSGETLTMNEAIESVLEDYNSIASAYVELVDTDLDLGYSAEENADRTIEICFGNSDGLSAGHAMQIYEGNRVVGCEIILGRDSLESAVEFIQLLTHEIGHCLGLMHPQETTGSVMSYFGGEGVFRLQADDKAGIVNLYPTNSSKAQESATLGAACSTR